MATTFFSSNDNDNVKCIPEEFDTAVKHGREIVNKIADTEQKQALVLQTADNNIREAIIDRSSDATAEEQVLLDAIGKNETVIRVICLWSDGTFDVPSHNFRKKLCELNPDNENAQILLNGENNFILKSIKATFAK